MLRALLPAGGVNVAGTLVGMPLVDRVGRRPLLLEGGVQMLLSQVGCGGEGGGGPRMHGGCMAVEAGSGYSITWGNWQAWLVVAVMFMLCMDVSCTFLLCNATSVLSVVPAAPVRLPRAPSWAPVLIQAAR